MGYIKHDAIVVTSEWHIKDLEAALKQAIELGLPCSGIVASPVNNTHSFLIATDGSKERWEHSIAGDKARAAWIEWVKANYSSIDWAHIRYGGDDPELAKLEAHSGYPESEDDE